MDGDWGSAVGLCQGRSRSLGAGGCHAAARPRKVRFVCFSLPGKAHSAHLRAKRRPCGTVALRNAPAGAALLVLSPQSLAALRGSLFANKPAASHCHAAAAARRHTAYPSAKNTLRLRRNCFFVCGARCAAATHASALPVTLRALRDGQRSSGAPPRGIAAAASATNVPPARLLTLRFRLHVLLAPLCAYPPRFLRSGAWR